MREKRSILLLASTATLALALGQGVLAESETSSAAPTAQGAQTATSPQPAAGEQAPQQGAPAGQEAAGAQPAAEPAGPAPATTTAAPQPAPEPATARPSMEERHAEMMEKRRARYEELRERAASAGLQLPETPPWEGGAMTPPEMPSPPEMPPMPGFPAMGKSPMTAEEREAMREARFEAMRQRAAESGIQLPETPPWKMMSKEERQAHWEAVRSMTPEERAAMREQHWAQMRERAAEQGMELPETPPWKQAQQRREEVRAKWESYREIVEQMTEEQREAAAAVFGRAQAPAGQMPQMPPPQQMPSAPVMPGRGPGPAAPWAGAAEPRMPAPPPAATGYGRGW